jgi:hypothetical protein
LHFEKTQKVSPKDVSTANQAWDVTSFVPNGCQEQGAGWKLGWLQLQIRNQNKEDDMNPPC